MNPVILVGRRADNGWRDHLWAWCERRWIALLPGVPVIGGHHDGPAPFSLSVASNRAAGYASKHYPEWDVAVYVGADWLAGDATHVREACETALRTGRLTFAHSRTFVLTEEATRNVLRLDPGAPLGALGPQDGSEHRNTFSGVVAIPRKLWNTVGGFDERIRQWGFDDLCFVDACNALGGGTDRIEGGLIAHLWHPQVWEEREGNPEHGANQLLWERYRQVKSDPDGMRALLAEPGGPLA